MDLASTVDDLIARDGWRRRSGEQEVLRVERRERDAGQGQHVLAWVFPCGGTQIDHRVGAALGGMRPDLAEIVDAAVA